MRREEEEEEGTRMKAKGDLEMKEEEAVSEKGELVGPCASAMPAPTPHNKGTRFSEVWEYFHLAPVRAGHHPNQYATCRLCGRQVSRGPGVNVGTTALWKHLKSMHREELEKTGHGQVGQRKDPRPQGPQLPMGIEGDWARLLEQVGALALWASQREKEVLRRERAVEWRERAVERRERALEEVERAILEMKWKAQALYGHQLSRKRTRSWCNNIFLPRSSLLVCGFLLVLVLGLAAALIATAVFPARRL